MVVLGISGLHRSVSFKQRELPGLDPTFYRIAQGFDAAAALVADDGVKAAVAEERFSRVKRTGAFPIQAIRYCLQSASMELSSVDYLAHCFDYEPYATFFQQSPFLRRQFQEVYSREELVRTAGQFLPDWKWSDRLVQVPHHLAHAASAFYLSGLSESLILVSDGMGEVHSATIAVGRGSDVEIVDTIPALHSLGILYSVCSLHLGFEVGTGEHKVMGLASYGNADRYFDDFTSLVHLHDDGTYTIPVLLANRSTLEKETYEGTRRILEDVFGPPRKPGEEITQAHADVAAALQAVLQVCLMHTLRHFRRTTGQRNLCMAGGIALNCTANGVIRRSRLFDNIVIQPAAGDDGAALGAALHVQRQRRPDLDHGRMALPLWGPHFSSDDVRAALAGREVCEGTRFERFDALVEDVVCRLAAGQIIGWVQGRMEFGPRALGNRSILADPQSTDVRDRINHVVKRRESFRPFAPAVVEEAASTYFEVDERDVPEFAYMLCVAPVRAEAKAVLKGVTHVDGSARLQTVNRTAHPRFWQLLDTYGRRQGIPVLLNTSFNVRGQPIVCTPAEALDTFLATELDAVVVENYIVTRKRVAPREVEDPVETPAASQAAIS